jgi:hypothetical protein
MENQKQQIAVKIGESAALLGVISSINEDEQGLFIAGMVLNVLKASQNQKHANLLNKNMKSFIYEVELMEGKITLGEFFQKKEKEGLL